MSEKEMTPAVYKAGNAKVLIDPVLPCELAGYFHSRPAERVNRELYVYALALESGGNRAVIVSADLIAMTDELCAPAFEMAARDYGVPLDNCVACATHTHTGPEIRRYSLLEVSDENIKMIQEALTEAVRKAIESSDDAVLCVGQTRAPGMAFNRLSRCADGSEIFGEGNAQNRVIGSAGPEDDSVQTLGIYGLERDLKGVSVNFACHPDLSGGGAANAVDSDWPGKMAEVLAAVHGNEVPFALWQGTAGDINQANHRAKVKRWLPGGCDHVARGVAGAALYAMETASPLYDATLECRMRELELECYTRDDALYALADRIRAKGDKATYFESNLMKRIDTYERDGMKERIHLACIRVGELAIVAMPGEIFTAWGLEIKRFSPAKVTMILELCSSEVSVGYKPTSDQALRGARGVGAYGALPVLSQRHTPVAGQMMADAVIEMLYELWN